MLAGDAKSSEGALVLHIEERNDYPSFNLDHFDGIWYLGRDLSVGDFIPVADIIKVRKSITNFRLCDDSKPPIAHRYVS